MDDASLREHFVSRCGAGVSAKLPDHRPAVGSACATTFWFAEGWQRASALTHALGLRFCAETGSSLLYDAKVWWQLPLGPLWQRRIVVRFEVPCVERRRLEAARQLLCATVDHF